MTNWTEKLRLKGLAEEDIYFARRDRELIEALHQRKSAKQRPAKKGEEKKVTTD
jgi:hypothetical protein